MTGMFVQADSRSLPKVDVDMVLRYLSGKTVYTAPEMRGVKEASMALITDYWILDILIHIAVTVFTIAVSVYFFYKYKFSYWGSRNVPHTKPTIPFGDLRDTNTRRSFGGTFKHIYETYPNDLFTGMWMLFRPTVLLRDAEMMKNVLIKDFDYFHDRGFHFEKNEEPLLQHLFALNGKKWRNLRVKLSPTFTSGKMKMMFPLVAECGKKLQEVLKKVADENDSLEAKDIMGRFTTDVITSCAFGIDVSSLQDTDSEFNKFAKTFSNRTFRDAITATLGYILPQAIPILGLKFVPPKLNEFFSNCVKSTIEHREQNNVQRNDFMQLLIELKNKGYVEDPDIPTPDIQEEIPEDEKFTMGRLTAQAFIFFFAGFETSSAAMQFTLLELSQNPDIQQKAREEVHRVLAKHDNKYTYEALQDMDYVDRVVQEALRKFPSATTLLRECTRDYPVPNTDWVIEKGTAVMVSVWGVHHDPRYYPNPDKFDPDRFLPEEKAKRPSCTYIPFGEGPRICIGVRFAMLQMKMAVASILEKFEMSVAPKTKLPLIMDPKHNLPIVVGGIHIDFRHLTK